MQKALASCDWRSRNTLGNACNVSSEYLSWREDAWPRLDRRWLDVWHVPMNHAKVVSACKSSRRKAAGSYKSRDGAKDVTGSWVALHENDEEEDENVLAEEAVVGCVHKSVKSDI
jgi:hypothetical protein